MASISDSLQTSEIEIDELIVLHAFHSGMVHLDAVRLQVTDHDPISCLAMYYLDVPNILTLDLIDGLSLHFYPKNSFKDIYYYSITCEHGRVDTLVTICLQGTPHDPGTAAFIGGIQEIELLVTTRNETEYLMTEVVIHCIEDEIESTGKIPSSTLTKPMVPLNRPQTWRNDLQRFPTQAKEAIESDSPNSIPILFRYNVQMLKETYESRVYREMELNSMARGANISDDCLYVKLHVWLEGLRRTNSELAADIMIMPLEFYKQIQDFHSHPEQPKECGSRYINTHRFYKYCPQGTFFRTKFIVIAVCRHKHWFAMVLINSAFTLPYSAGAQYINNSSRIATSHRIKDYQSIDAIEHRGGSTPDGCCNRPKLLVFDSLDDPNSRKNTAEIVMKWFQNEAKRCEPMFGKPVDFEILYVKVPRQPQFSLDCAIYTETFVRRFFSVPLMEALEYAMDPTSLLRNFPWDMLEDAMILQRPAWKAQFELWGKIYTSRGGTGSLTMAELHDSIQDSGLKLQ